MRGDENDLDSSRCDFCSTRGGLVELDDGRHACEECLFEAGVPDHDYEYDDDTPEDWT